MAEYAVESVEAGNPWTSAKGGPMNSWKLMVNDGEKSFAAEISTKQGNDGPKVGERFEATLTDGNPGYPPKLKKVFANAGGGGGGGWKPKTVEEQQAINRAVAQKNAILLLGVEVQAGKNFDQEPASKMLTPRIDFLFADLERAAGR